MGKQVIATYKFSWYELDQMLEVGKEDSYYFKASQEDLEFLNGLLDDDTYKKIKCKILKISHPELGLINKIETRGLDYKISLDGGKTILVEAEEDPGNVYDFEIKPKQWTFDVSLELVHD